MMYLTLAEHIGVLLACGLLGFQPLKRGAFWRGFILNANVKPKYIAHALGYTLPFKSNWSSLRYHAVVQNCNSKQRLDTVLTVFVTTQLVT